MTAAHPGRRTVVRGAAAVVGAAAAATALGACASRPPAGTPAPAPAPGGPVTSAALIGRTLRVYHSGDPLSRDYREDRANIELGPDEAIVRVWIG